MKPKIIVAILGAGMVIVVGCLAWINQSEHPGLQVRKTASSKTKLVPNVAAKKARLDLESVLTEINSQRRSEQQELWINSLNNTEIAAALESLVAMEQRKGREEMIRQLLRKWVENDPSEAANFLESTLKAKLNERALWANLIPQVAAEWSKTDPKRALIWLGTLTKHAERTFAEQQILQEWCESEPIVAAKYAAQTDSKTLITLVAAAWAEKNPKSAADWAVRLPVGENREAALVRINASWAATDPAAMAIWSAHYPEGPSREQMLGQLSDAWARSGDVEAQVWLEKLPESPSRDFALSAFCQVVEKREPAVSFRLATKILQPELRNQKLLSAGAAWLNKNPSEAQKQITASQLPAPLKENLLATWENTSSAVQ